jgi:hypothetical protein
MELTSTNLQKLVDVINAHEEVSEKLRALDNVSAHYEPFRNLLKQLPENKGEHFRKTAERFAEVVIRFSFVSLVSRRKVDAINQLIMFSINTANAIALAQGVRSLVEHIAVQVRTARVIEQLSNKLEGQTDTLKIHDALSKAEEFLQRCYYGKSPKIEQEKIKQALHINDCIDALEAESPGIIKSYDFLCEFVHPNHGSNSLVSTSDILEQISSISVDISRPEIQKMAEIGITTLTVNDAVESLLHSYIAVLGEYAHRFTQPSSKITNIFAVRKINPVGDGKSKETAFHFPTARDAMESIKLWAQYLNNREISIKSRHLAAMEGQSAYDLYETSQGPLWCRVDHPMIEKKDESTKS